MNLATAPSRASARPYLLGGRIDVSWSNPPASASGPGQAQVGARVMRRERTYSLGPDDGHIVYDGPVVDRVTDSGLTPGTRYYYTIFVYDGSRYLTGDGARVNALATGYGRLPGELYALLPAVHQREDTGLRPDEIAALPAEVAARLAGLPPELAAAGQLRRFLEAALAPLAAARSNAEALPQLRDLEFAAPEFLPLLAGFLDAPIDQTLPVHLERGELRAAPPLLRMTGTVAALRSAVARYSGWQARVTEYAQNIARSNDAAQCAVFALRTAESVWVGADDAAPELGFGPGNTSSAGTGTAPAVLSGSIPGPFRLRAGMELSVRVDGLLPVTVRFTEGDAENLAAATTGELVEVLTRLLPEAGARSLPDGRLQLRSPGGAPASTVTITPSDGSPITLQGAVRGRIAVADFGSPYGVRVGYEVDDGAGGRRLTGLALHDGVRGDPFALLPRGPAAQGQPALVALPPAAAGSSPRAMLVWVADPGTDHARLRWLIGTVTAPGPAVLTGERAGRLAVPDGSWLVLRNGRGQRRGVRFVAADWADPAGATPAEAVSALQARLAGFASARVAPGGRVQLVSSGTGPAERLDVDPDLSSAAAALGLTGSAASARGSANDTIEWVAGPDPDGNSTIATVPAGWLADPAAALDPAGGVTVAYARHDGQRWQVRTVRWDGTAWSGDTLLPDDIGSAGGAREPTLAVVQNELWAAWSGREDAAAPWTLRFSVRQAGGWSSPAALLPAPVPAAIPGPDPDRAPLLAGDRQPALLTTAAAQPTVVFASDRGGSAALWTAPAGTDPTPVTSGPAADGWPALMRIDGDTWLLFRSDRNVAPARAGRGRGQDTGTLRRRAGTVTPVPRDLGRIRGAGGWGDLLAYTPQRPEGESPGRPLTDLDRYTRGTVGLHLTQAASGPLDAATAARLRVILRRVVPITVRVLVHLASPVLIEEVYSPDADLQESHRDRYPEIEHLAPVTETSTIRGIGWAVLRSATPSTPPPADPEAGGVAADPNDRTTLRRRTQAPPLE